VLGRRISACELDLLLAWKTARGNALGGCWPRAAGGAALVKHSREPQDSSLDVSASTAIRVMLEWLTPDDMKKDRRDRWRNGCRVSC